MAESKKDARQRPLKRVQRSGLLRSAVNGPFASSVLLSSLPWLSRSLAEPSSSPEGHQQWWRNP